MSLRPPLVTFERIKRLLLLVGLAVVLEAADPRPFRAGLGANVLYLLMLFEIVRQWWVWRLEVSVPATWTAQRTRVRWDALRLRWDADTRYRLRRLIGWLGGALAWGWLVDGLTSRCTGAWQCAVLTPILAAENLPEILQFAVYVAITLLQLFILFWSMTKVGSWKQMMPGTVTVAWGDVFGQDAAKELVQEQIALLDDDEKVRAAGGHMPKGLLLHGPPGTGKTLLARAAAAATSKPLILVPPGAFASTFVGINFLKVGSLFRSIRRLSLRWGGVVVFIDELDALGTRGGGIEQSTIRPIEGCAATPPEPSASAELDRLPDLARSLFWRAVAPAVNRVFVGTGVSSGSNMGTLEAFLAAMDGMEEPRGLVNRMAVALGFRPLPAPPYRYLMLGATNRIAAIDPALLRPGRFGRHVKVGFPDAEGREATYSGYLRRVIHDLAPEQVAWVARSHWHGTGAEIEQTVNEAVLASFRTGQEGRIDLRLLTDALIETRYGRFGDPFEAEENRWAVAVHEAGHAVAAHHLRRARMPIWFGTIRGAEHGAGGMVASSPVDDDWHMLRTAMLANIQTSLASRVAERLFFGETSNGHGGDGRSATRAAIELVQRGGSGRRSFFDQETTGDLQLDLAEEGPFASSVEQVLWEAELAVESLLRPRKAQIAVVASLLLGELTVDGERIHEALDAMERVAATAEGWA